MSRKQSIETCLHRGLEPVLCEVVDESHQHSVPEGAETHFNVMVVSEGFADLSRVERHRRVHELLAEELHAGLHALTLTLLTPAEHDRRRGDAIASPRCLGGSKAG